MEGTAEALLSITAAGLAVAAWTFVQDPVRADAFSVAQERVSILREIDHKGITISELHEPRNADLAGRLEASCLETDRLLSNYFHDSSTNVPALIGMLGATYNAGLKNGLHNKGMYRKYALICDEAQIPMLITSSSAYQ